MNNEHLEHVRYFPPPRCDEDRAGPLAAIRLAASARARKRSLRSDFETAASGAIRQSRGSSQRLRWASEESIRAATRSRGVRRVDRDRQDVVLEALHATHSDEAEDVECAVAGPSSPATGPPRRLRMDATGARRRSWCSSRLRPRRRWGRSPLSRCLPRPLPGQRVPQPPALRLEGGERTLHLILRLRASADSTTTSKRKPAASVEAQPDGRKEQQPGQRPTANSAAGD